MTTRKDTDLEKDMERFWCWAGKNEEWDEALGRCIEEIDANSAAASFMYKQREYDGLYDGYMEEDEYEIVWAQCIRDDITKRFKVKYDEESDTYWAEELPNG